jgi:predicted nucleotidyltransferase
MKSEELLSEIKKAIASDYPSSEIILYGSRARKEEKAFSDWDILIIIDDNLTENQKIAIHDKLFEIELKTGKIINSIIHTKREWTNPLMQATPFYHNVTKEGITL